MFGPRVHLAFTIVWLALFVGALAGWHLGRVSPVRATDVAGVSLVWLGYGVLQLTDDSWLGLEPPLEYGVLVLVLGCIGGGLYCWLGYDSADSDTY